MDKYRKSAEEIMKRGDKIIAEKKRRSAVYKRTVFAVSGLCAAIIAGVEIWNSPQLHKLVSREKHDNNSIIADSTEHSESHTETATTLKDVIIVTDAATSGKNTVASTTVSTIKQTEKKQNTQTAPVASNTTIRHTQAGTTAVTLMTTIATETAPPVSKTTIAVETTIASVSTTGLNEDSPTLSEIPEDPLIPSIPVIPEAIPITTTATSPIVMPAITRTVPQTNRTSKTSSNNNSTLTTTTEPDSILEPIITTAPPKPPYELVTDKNNDVINIIYNSVSYGETGTIATDSIIEEYETVFLGRYNITNKKFYDLTLIKDYSDIGCDALALKPYYSGRYFIYLPDI